MISGEVPRVFLASLPDFLGSVAEEPFAGEPFAAFRLASASSASRKKSSMDSNISFWAADGVGLVGRASCGEPKGSSGRESVVCLPVWPESLFPSLLSRSLPPSVALLSTA